MRRILIAAISLVLAGSLGGCYVYSDPYGFGAGFGRPYYAHAGGYNGQAYNGYNGGGGYGGGYGGSYGGGYYGSPYYGYGYGDGYYGGGY